MQQLTLAQLQEFPVRRKYRSLNAPTFQMSALDVEVITAIHRYHVLDSDQVVRLFNLLERTAQRRLSFLHQHGYLERMFRPLFAHKYRPIELANARRGPVYRLAARGAQLLAREQGIPLQQFQYWGKGDDRDSHYTLVSYPFLEHMVTLADIRMSVERAAAACLATVEVWRDEVELRKARAWEQVTFRPDNGKAEQTVKVTPDGYFILRTAHGERGHFFIEADRGTEAIAERWRQKIFSYKALQSSGIFQQRYQVEPRTGFRVLITTPTALRTLNIKAAAERYGSADLASRFLCAPISEVTHQNMLTDPIWLRGGTTAAQTLL